MPSLIEILRRRPSFEPVIEVDFTGGAPLVIDFSGDDPEVPKRAALVISPNGALVEQLAGDPIQKARDELMGRAQPETLLKDVIDAIEAGKDDDRVKALVLDLPNQSEWGLLGMNYLRRFRMDINTDNGVLLLEPR